MRLLRIALLAAVAGTLLVAPAAHGWVRKESDRWVWYVPSHRWVDAQSDHGIDITSPTGALFVGHGFGPTVGPVTHGWAARRARRSGGLDPHPLRRVRFSRPSRPVVHDGIVRRVYRWRGYRTDRRERVRGVLTVDVINNPATFTFGYALYGRTAPTRLFGRWDRRLRFMQRHISLKPRTPEWGF
jgi:hypothetical protein